VRAREALRTQGEWLRVTLHSIGDAVLAVDTEGKITFLNPVAAQLTGWPEAEALGLPARAVFRIVNDQTHRPVENIIGRVLQEGQRVTLANHTALVNRQGREIPVEDSAAPILDSAGKTLGAVLVFHDVTEKRRAQEALREERERLRLALEASHAGTWEWDLRTNENLWSDELWTVYGLEPHSCRPSYEAWLQVVHPEDRALAEKTVQDAARNGTEIYHELRVQDRDGKVRWLMSLGRPLRDADGLVARFIGIVVDITERKRAEQQRLEWLAKERTLAAEKALRETEAELARVARGLAVGEMASSIAHEVNQPLAGVVTNAEAGLRWLGAETPDLHEVRESLKLIVRDANRASGIIRRIREFTRKGGRHTAQLEVNEVIQETVALAHGELLKRRISLRTELSKDLPPVLGDRIQLEQVLLNLS
jgi:PAS domain S-box-containing protein